jgi:hypothetical protein
MATGDLLITLDAQQAIPPATLAAALDTIAGGSTPAEVYPVVAYDDTIQEYMDFVCDMPPNYSGGGITLRIKHGASDVASDVVEWQAAFRRIADDAEDLDTSQTYDFNTVVATVPSAVGEVAYDVITFTSGADMDNVAVGDRFGLRVTRDPTPSSGTNATGDAYLHSIEVKET